MPAPGPEPSDSTPPALRLDASYRNLERVMAWANNADNKALISLAFQGAVLAALASVADRIAEALERGWGCTLVWLLAATCIAFVFAFGASLLYLFRSVHPDTTPSESDEDRGSVFFFGSIARMTPEEFGVQMRSLDQPRIEREVARQTHVIAGITSRKFRYLKVANKWLGGELLLLLAAVVLIAFL